LQLRFKKQRHYNRMVNTYTIEYWQLEYPCECYDNKYADIDATSEEEALSKIKNDYEFRFGKRFKITETINKQ